jgi:hypothetical protein
MKKGTEEKNGKESISQLDKSKAEEKKTKV